MTEIEIKLRVDDAGKAAEKVRAAGARLIRPRHLEDNTLYDFEDGRLAAKGQALRLRKTGRRGLLTFKGPTVKSRSFKVRAEHETAVKDPAELRKILKALGLKPVFSYRKHRTLFLKGRLRVALDETKVGCFLELEGERHEIVRFAGALGYERRDFIRADYVQLLKEAGAESPAAGGETAG
jgi:adenylate cyclase class 2